MMSIICDLLYMKQNKTHGAGVLLASSNGRKSPCAVQYENENGYYDPRGDVKAQPVGRPVGRPVGHFE